MNDCSCQSGLGQLLGRLRGLNDPVPIGAAFSIGFELTNFGFEDFSFRSSDEVAEAIASRLTRAGLIQGLVRGYKLTGYFNPYIVVEGFSGKAWGKATQFRDAILSIAKSESDSVNFATVNFQVETLLPGSSMTTETRAEAPIVANVAPSTGGAGLTTQLSSTLGISGLESKQLLIGGAIVFAILLLRR